MFKKRLPSPNRRIPAAYAVAFFLAAAAAPHRHLNGMEDLLSDGPSDSGLVLAGPIAPVDAGPVVEPMRLLDDDPCPACFQHDFVASAAAVFTLSSPSTRLAPVDPASPPAVPEPASGRPASRSPPAAL